MRSALVAATIAAAVMTVAVGSSVKVDIPVPNPDPIEMFTMQINYMKGSSVTMVQQMAWDLLSNRAAVHFDVSPSFPTTMTQVSRYDLNYFIQSTGNTYNTFQCENMTLTGHLSKFWALPPNMDFKGLTTVAGVQAYYWEFLSTSSMSEKQMNPIWDSLQSKIVRGAGDVMQFAIGMQSMNPVAYMNLNTSMGYHYTNYVVGNPPLSAFVVPELVSHPDWKCPKTSP